MELEFLQSQEQKQTISAAQIQSLKLLELDNFALQQMMEKEYLENPLLEYDPPRAPAASQTFHCPDTGSELFQRERTLEQYIMNQLNFRQYTSKELSVIRFMIRNLDDSGFFVMEEKEAASLNRVSEAMVHRLLTDLKKLEPCGIFAPNLKESLLLQLYSDGMPNPLVKVLITDHLEALGKGDIRGVAKALSLPTAQIREALSEISRLNPRPLNGLDTSQADYIIPDILLRWDPHAGIFQAERNDDWYADYHISDYYLKMVRSTQDPALRAYFEKKYLRAKFLVEGIAQRWETLLRIAAYAAQVQCEFLLGRGPKVPMTMTEVADALEMSVSTVSRGVKDKYIQYPLGCVAFKTLFETPAVRQESGNVPGRDVIKETLKAMIQEEDPAAPLSDDQLAQRLAAQGITISRRTVAKYRDSLGIPGRFQRKED